MRSILLCTLSIFVCLSLSCTAGSGSKKVNVVLIIIDTLSADHLGCYGYSRDTSPTIDSLAATGIQFMNCQAQAPWTLPGMASIFTGLTERSHKCGLYDDCTYGLDPEVPTLATILKENGYFTAALFNVGWLAEPFGMAKDYDCLWINLDESDNADVTVDTLLHYFSNNDIHKPFFTAVHFFDVHLPYDPPDGFDTCFEPRGACGITQWRMNAFNEYYPSQAPHLMKLYDGEIKWTDSQISRLLAGMREMELTENTLFILVSDHGEEFLQHGDTGHGGNLYQLALHVPLIFTGPGIEPGSVSQNVGQIDLLPSVLGYLEIPVPDHVEGISLFGEIPSNRVMPSSGVIDDSSSVACLQESRKVIWHMESDSSETYNLENDPGETDRLTTDSLLLQEALDYWAWPCICTPTHNDEAEIEIKQLVNLGYI
jgi:choline-sulfatase